MNKFLSFITAFLLVCSCSAQHRNGMQAFYDHYASAENVTQIKVPRFLLRMGADDPELRKAIRYMHSLRIFTLERPSAAPRELRHQLDRALAADGFESVLEIKEQQERIGIYIVADKDMVKHILLAIEDAGELVLLQARTHFSLDQLSDFLSDVGSGGDKKGLNALYTMNK